MMRFLRCVWRHIGQDFKQRLDLRKMSSMFFLTDHFAGCRSVEDLSIIWVVPLPSKSGKSWFIGIPEPKNVKNPVGG